MVYVLAAYTITIGVLLIYGVLLQHRARLARARLAGAGLAASPEQARGFNLGAALLAPFWAIAHGQPAIGGTLLVTWVAFAAAQASGLRLAVLLLGPLLIGASLFFGVVGNRIVAARSGGRDPIRCERGQLPWALAGAVLYAVVLPWVWHFAVGPR
ncbi:MAG: hypothetical protein R3F35_11420 [Myxococcota bacterium]